MFVLISWITIFSYMVSVIVNQNILKVGQFFLLFQMFELCILITDNIFLKCVEDLLQVMCILKK